MSVERNRRQFLRDSALLVAAGNQGAQAAVDEAASLKPLWPSSSLFQEELVPGLGFSFAYDGKTVGPGLPEGWNVVSDRTTTGVRTTLRHASGLTVVRDAVAYSEAEAVEYTVRFRNDSETELPAVAGVNAIDLSFGAGVARRLSLVSSSGGMTEGIYPPDVFAVRRRYFGPMAPLSAQVMLGTIGGRSSDKDLPFFFLVNDEKNQGVFVAIGWSGQWSVRVADDLNRDRVQLQGGMTGIDIRLKPGEEISGPRILIGAYRGPLSAGSNRLRRLIRDRYTPPLEGRKPQPPVTYDHWWNIGLGINEQLARTLADAAADLGQENFLLDAGWYAGIKPSPDFAAGLGNWKQEDREKFPGGIKALAEYVRSKGLGFGIWLEPERVAKGSRLAQDHPEWIVWRADSPGATPPNPAVYATQISPAYGLLNYGLPEVQDHVVSLFDYIIGEYSVRYIRYDCNIAPLIYWESMDGPGRRGIAQIRHIEGLYKVLDRIRERHPKTILEGCASGGRRIDLETARRFHTFWISDHTIDPHIVRWHLHGLQHFLPGNYAYVCHALPMPHRKRFDLSDLSFQSFFGGAFGTGGRIDEWPAELRARARKHVEVYKQLRRFLVEDYYPLTRQPPTLDLWQAWQFHDPSTGEGFVQAFRLDAPDSLRAFPLHAIDAGAVYLLTDPYSRRTLRESGRKLQDEGAPFSLPSMASGVLLYRRG